MSYLRVEDINYLNFKCQDPQNQIISIEQEYMLQDNNGQMLTRFEEIYKIKIHQLDVRELLILRSFLFTSSNSEVVKLVMCQPNPSFFYKTCLELDGSNLTSLLSFDT